MIDYLKIDRDTVIDYIGKAVGAKGELFVEQDPEGFHTISLADGNIGAIELGMQPGVVTKLTWSRVPGKCFWVSETVTKQLVINNPAAIGDHQLGVNDANSVRVKWTAPSGNPPNTDVTVDKYRIYVSESQLFPDSNVSYMSEYKQSVVPFAPGQQETLVIKRLVPGTLYYILIISEKTIFGKTRLSTGSNVIQVLTKTNNDTGGNEPPEIVPIDREHIYEDSILMEADPDTGAILDLTSFIDMTGIVSNNGVPEGTPVGGFRPYQYGRGSTDAYNRTGWDLFMDLQGAWDISYFYIWNGTNCHYEVQTSIDGVNYKTVADVDSSFGYGKWGRLDIEETYAKGIRWVRLHMIWNDMIIRKFLIYGKRKDAPTPAGQKYKRLDNGYPMDERIGTNGFLLENKDMVRPVCRMMRVYTESDWFAGDGFKETGTMEGKSYTDFQFMFQSQGIWNWDEELTAFKATGMRMFICMNNAFVAMRPAGFSGASATKPLDPGLAVDVLANTTNPNNYKVMARFAYNFAARYGHNPDVDQQYIQLDPKDEVKVGLGLVEQFEWGNERDAWWNGINGYFNPEEMAAILSAIGDGHKGTMGPGMGLHAADPTMKFSMSSFAVSDNIGYVKKMMLWWDLYRGRGDYPINMLNFHNYNSTAASQSVSVWSDEPSEGSQPEIAGFMPLMSYWSDFRDREIPQCEIWLTEYGYDEQWGGVISPNFRDQFSRSRAKAYWLLRTPLVGHAMGIDIFNQYWYANTTIRLEDIGPNDWIRDMFITSGMTDGIIAYNDWNRKPLMSYHYVQQFMTEISGWKYTHAIIMAGQVISESSPFRSYHPDLWALAFKKGNDTMIISWLGSGNFSSTDLQLSLDASEANVSVVKFDDAEIRGGANGITTLYPSASDANGNYITINISELVTFIKTKNVSAKKLIAPENLTAQPESISAIRLSWRDRNIGTNKTKVFRSANPDSDFNLIYFDYIDDGTFLDTGLPSGAGYFYRVQFYESDTVVSDISLVIGGATYLAIVPPSNLTASTTFSNKVELTWQLTPENEAIIDSLEVLKSNTLNGNFDVLETLQKSKRSFIDIGLVPDKTYFYKIRSRKGIVTSEMSNVAQGTTVTLDSAYVQLLTPSRYNGWRAQSTDEDPEDRVDTTFISYETIYKSASLIQLQFSNNLYTSEGDTADMANPDPVDIKVTVKYGGELIPVYFGGGRTRTMAPGEIVMSDVIAGLAVPDNARLEVRVFLHQHGPVIPTNRLGAGDEETGGPAYPLGNDYTDAETGFGAHYGLMFAATGVYGKPAAGNTPVIALVGDDVTYGDGTSDIISELEKALQTLQIPYLNVCLRGESAYTFINAANTTRRAAHLSQGCFTHAISQMGLRDLTRQINNTDGEAITNITALHTILHQTYGFTKTAQTDLLPMTDSNDKWKTTTGQSYQNREDSRVPVNNWIMGNAVHMFDVALSLCAIVEVDENNNVSPGSGLWLVNGTNYFSTQDGLHPSNSGRDYLATNIKYKIQQFLIQ